MDRPGEVAASETGRKMGELGSSPTDSRAPDTVGRNAIPAILVNMGRSLGLTELPRARRPGSKVSRVPKRESKNWACHSRDLPFKLPFSAITCNLTQYMFWPLSSSFSILRSAENLRNEA